MIDQLWVFVTSANTIFTFFPQNNSLLGPAMATSSSSAVPSNFADLHDYIVEGLHDRKSSARGLCHNAFEMAALCLYSSVTVLMSKTEGLGPGVIEMFQAAISKTQEDAIKSLDAFVDDPNSIVHLTIDYEPKLLRKAADLDDELGILIHLFNEQRKVLEEFISHINKLMPESNALKIATDTRQEHDGEDGEDHHRTTLM